MKILWHSAHPDMPTGYGSQSALLLPRIRAMGHEIAVSVTAGVDSHPGYWQGIPVFPKTPYADIGEDVIAGHHKMWEADLVITFFCTWIVRYPAQWRDMRVIHITNVDCEPMSIRDYRVICETGGTPAATSRTGERIMRAGGRTPARPLDQREPLTPLYLPHGVDTRCFRPAADRAAIRDSMEYGDDFVVGMNFMNNDKFRKNLDACLQGFALFHAKHPDTLLALHAIQALPEGYNLPVMCQFLGISKAVRWTPQYELVTGMIPPPVLAEWYGALDVYLGCGNEGFGLPAVEAQACGTPVILGDWSTGPELAGDGWLVDGQPWYNDTHQAMWHLAFIESVADALEKAYDDARNRRDTARDNALAHDINRITREHWEPTLGELG